MPQNEKCECDMPDGGVCGKPTVAGHVASEWAPEVRVCADHLKQVMEMPEKCEHEWEGVLTVRPSEWCRHCHMGRYTNAHARELEAQVEKLEKRLETAETLLQKAADEINDLDGCMCQDGEAGGKSWCLPCEVAETLGIYHTQSNEPEPTEGT